jgi:hypothetical protein
LLTRPERNRKSGNRFSGKLRDKQKCAIGKVGTGFPANCAISKNAQSEKRAPPMTLPLPASGNFRGKPKNWSEIAIPLNPICP